MPETTDTPVETDLFTVTMTSVNDLRADIVVSDITLTYKEAQVGYVTTLSAVHSDRYFSRLFGNTCSPMRD